MKKVIYYCLFLMPISLMIISCEKDKLAQNRQDIYINPSTSTQVRFIHALSSNAINTASPITATTAPPALNFFVDGIRLNPISSASQTFTSSYGGAFPGTAIAAASANGNNVFDYAVVPGGTVRVAGAMFRLTGGTSADTVVATTLALENGKKYSIVAADTIPNQRFFAFEDNLPTTDTGNYGIRFINLTPTVPATLTGIDIYSRRRAANLVTNVAYKTASDYILSPVLVNGVTTDTLEIRSTGTTTTLAQFNGFLPVRTRVYTFVVRGVSTLASPRNLQMAGYLNK